MQLAVEINEIFTQKVLYSFTTIIISTGITSIGMA